MEGFDRCFLDCSDHSFGLAVGPGMIWFGEAMLDAVALAGALEDVADPDLRHLLIAIDELVRNADLALYSAKHAGRGRFSLFSREMLEAAEERRVLEDEMHDALSRGKLELTYQPVVCA